jgi:hypothetical protein
LWQACRDPNGYGQIRLTKGICHYTHRISWELSFGKIPRGKLVCHHCDNPPCVRPDHLFLGTHKDNIQDMIRKGRHKSPRIILRGSANKNSKLTEADVQSIRKLIGQGKTHRLLAKLFHVGKSTITRIKNNKTWLHVSPAQVPIQMQALRHNGKPIDDS